MKAARAWKATLIVLFLLLAVPLALADKTSGPKYNPATETKVSGTVEEVKEVMDGDEKETHLVVKTDSGLIEVCLCPAKFLSELEMSFQKGDKIEVTGSKVTDSKGETEVLAREIVRGENTLVLRDKQGGPVWTWLIKK
ncbi:MAG TPA: hypothetical protein VD837_10185 [Terriglobales bacterium]|nr:hypothetical protein [Terriglobales bacterium]